ncbi:hypothetical protein [Rhizobium sp. BK376]|uniref:hypothetical protein n=1 Tax=Rhizobium sp. BK376 TaxID=2512149 RepID=UPI0010488D7B|nr:hypothetical protein [Rhizobium sp. BK376]TCR78691.1 hypothetical protein EV561_11765 [Rhizobium sp. BK376]
MSASSTSYGFSLIGAGIPVPVVGQPAKQDDHGETLATITPGNWNLTNQQQDLSGLNTDASKASTQVDPFDIDKLKAQQQSAAALSQLMNMAIGYLGQKYGLADGGSEKVALHAAAGALTALISGGSVSTGALSGAAQELIGAVVDKALADNPDLTQDERNALGQWASVLVGMAAGGTQGAATALDAEKYNRQLHIDEANLIKNNAAQFAYDQRLCGNATSPSGCSQDAVNVAIGELTMQALKQVDATAADVTQDSAAAAFLDSIAPRDTACAPGGTNCYYFHAYGDEYQDATINSQYFARVLNLYNLASQVYATEHTTSKDFAGELDSAAQTITGAAQARAAVDKALATWEVINGVFIGAATSGAPATAINQSLGFEFEPLSGSAYTGANNTALSPSQQARAWQGSGYYPGVDNYVDILLSGGSYVVGAAPGQSVYYTTLQGYLATGGTAKGYYNALQIKPNTDVPYPPYRDGVTIYQVNGNTSAAYSSATTANPVWGSGGAPQFFIPDFKNSLVPLFSIPFKD